MTLELEKKGKVLHPGLLSHSESSLIEPIIPDVTFDILVSRRSFCNCPALLVDGHLGITFILEYSVLHT